MAEQFQTDLVRALRELALSYPGVTEGSSCVNRAFAAGSKRFLYLGEKPDSYRVMVKLDGSLDDAVKLSEREPQHYAVGKGGWVTVVLPRSQHPPPGLFEGWIGESYRLQAGKKLLAQLD